MSDRDQAHKPGLSRREIQDVRRKLRDLDGKASLTSRVGNVMSYPSTTSGNVRRYRFGISLLLLAIFLMLVVAILPNDDRRLYFGSFAIAMALVAAWQIDLAKKR